MMSQRFVCDWLRYTSVRCFDAIGCTRRKTL